jgi:Glycerol-3-phosphate dehydrogenase
MGFDQVLSALQTDYPALPEAMLRRMVRAYGTRARRILQGAECLEDLGRLFGTELTQAELDYLIKTEWAQTAEDVLWRRSKLGLHMNKTAQQAVAEYMAAQMPGKERSA